MKDISGKNHTAVLWIIGFLQIKELYKTSMVYFEFKPNNPAIHKSINPSSGGITYYLRNVKAPSDTPKPENRCL